MLFARIDRKAPAEPCALCGLPTTHADSIMTDGGREHSECRRLLRRNAINEIILSQDYLRVADWLSKEGVLFPRLESRLERFLAPATATNLCRMIAFILNEISADPSIRRSRKRLLEERLKMTRSTYLPRAN